MRITDAKFDTLEKTKPGSLVVYCHSGKWLRCLAVAFPDEQTKTKVDLLALESSKDEDGKVRGPFFLLQAPNDGLCMQVGKAEFYMLPADLKLQTPHAADAGNIVLSNEGAAIIGLRSIDRGRTLPLSWLLSTGEKLGTVDVKTLPHTQKWKAGIVNADGKFEEVLCFPFT